VFALDVAARHRVQFQMPGAEAVAMLKERFNGYRLTRSRLAISPCLSRSEF
jgi:Fe2+ or Zn2+ uptake regulation protein